MVLGRNGLLRQAFQDKAIYDTASVAHLIQHPLAYLEGRDGVRIAPSQYAENIELLVCNVVLGENFFDPFQCPTVGIKNIDECLVPGISKPRLLDVLVYTHACEGRRSTKGFSCLSSTQRMIFFVMVELVAKK